PAVFEDRAVPEVLRNGIHAAIESWRRDARAERTGKLRPDLLRSDRGAGGAT
ncbi:MAG TPA: tRNA (guanosine(37)-N1)-methyltransferase TrmD, partial [Candidatus Dormibacteraeota bacterium]|nr:tRNA (guanosine(37)-N1)-methyltransferase TrmD [Candidatus Dormibacteraeota bacterium]